MWFFDCFLFWLFWDLLGWFGSPIESSFQNCGWTVKRAQPRCGCYGKQLGSGCRRDQRRVYRPRALSALLESITAHRRANARRKSSDVRRWEGKVQRTGDKRSSPSKFIPWLSIKKNEWVAWRLRENQKEEKERERVWGNVELKKRMTELDISDTGSALHIQKCQRWTERERLLSSEHYSRVKSDSVCVSSTTVQ